MADRPDAPLQEPIGFRELAHRLERRATLLDDTAEHVDQLADRLDVQPRNGVGDELRRWADELRAIGAALRAILGPLRRAQD